MGTSQATPSLTASTTNAVAGETIILNVNNAPLGTHLVWASNSPAGSMFSPNGQGSAHVAFTAPGTYTVTAYIVSGAGQDSIPVHDTSFYPNYIPPADSSNHPNDTLVIHPPVDTTSHYPHDTLPNNPTDTTPSYPHDTLPTYPPPPPPHDSTNYYPYDSTVIDSIAHLHNQHIIRAITIVITVH